MRETWVRSLGREDPLEKEMATHSSTLAWRIPWTEEPGGLQSAALQSRTRLSDFTFTFHFQTQSISVLSTRFCKYLYPPWYSFVEILMSREMVWGDGALGKHLSHESEELVNEISAHIKRLSRAPSALWGYNKNSVTLKRAPSSWASSLPNHKKKILLLISHPLCGILLQQPK